MTHTHLVAKLSLLAVVSCLVTCGLLGCSNDDSSSGGGDCSKCSASTKDQCTKTFSDCTGQGHSASDCQTIVDVICALGGDGGLKIDLDAGHKKG
jgi:hypothetical protein